jgi:hypothetical protein
MTDEVPEQHVAAQGDCISSIASQYGFGWETVWRADGNDGLRDTRDPNILNPGDVVHLPEQEDGDESGDTDEDHDFEADTEEVLLRLRLLDDGEPRANLDYTLVVGERNYEHHTNGDGVLEHPIPPRETTGQLTTGEGEVYSLNLGYLNPVSETSGVQQRLFNLGYFGGEADGTMNDELRGAIRRFQDDEDGLEANGNLDDATRNRLKERHGD